MAKLFGDLFEQAALVKLLAGGKFRYYDLSAGVDAGELVLLPSAKAFFNDAADLALAVRARDAAALDATLFVPSSGTYTSVDAVLGRGRALVNFTINTAHQLKLMHTTRCGEGAAPVAVALERGNAFDFYWVLPPERYDAACKRRKPFPVVFPQRPNDNAPLPAVRQFAVCIDF